MDKIIYLYAIDADYQHQTDKICINLENEPDKSDTRDKEQDPFPRLYEIIKTNENCVNIVEEFTTKWKNDIMMREYCTVTDVIQRKMLCNKCLWFIRYYNRSEMEIDEYHISIPFENPKSSSDWSIQKIYNTSGVESTEYDQTQGGVQKYTKYDILALRETLNKNSPTEQNDKDAFDETSKALDWIDEIFTKYPDKNIEILYFGVTV
jgi:hypothetical protein